MSTTLALFVQGVTFESCQTFQVYSHGQEFFYKFVSKITNKLVKQLLSMTVHLLKKTRNEIT